MRKIISTFVKSLCCSFAVITTIILLNIPVVYGGQSRKAVHSSDNGFFILDMKYNQLTHKEFLEKLRKQNKWFIRCFNDQESFYKIGKTFLSVQKRYGCQNCKSSMPYRFEVLKTIIGTGRNIFDLEINLKCQHKEYKYKPQLSFAGESECFSYIKPEIIV